MNIENLNIISLPVVVLGHDETGPLVSSANGQNPHARGGLELDVTFSDVPDTIRIASLQEVQEHNLLVESSQGTWSYRSKSVLRDGKEGVFYDYFDLADGQWSKNGGEPVTTPSFRDAPFKGLEHEWTRFEYSIRFRLWFCVISGGQVMQPLGSLKWELRWIASKLDAWSLESWSASTADDIRSSFVPGGDLELVRTVTQAPDVKVISRKFFTGLEERRPPR